MGNSAGTGAEPQDSQALTAPNLSPARVTNVTCGKNSSQRLPGVPTLYACRYACARWPRLFRVGFRGLFGPVKQRAETTTASVIPTSQSRPVAIYSIWCNREALAWGICGLGAGDYDRSVSLALALASRSSLTIARITLPSCTLAAARQRIHGVGCFQRIMARSTDRLSRRRRPASEAASSARWNSSRVRQRLISTCSLALTLPAG